MFCEGMTIETNKYTVKTTACHFRGNAKSYQTTTKINYGTNPCRLDFFQDFSYDTSVLLIEQWTIDDLIFFPL